MMKFTIVLIASCLVLQGQCFKLNSNDAPSAKSNRELRGYETIGDEEFYFGTEQVGWHDARVLCQNMSMQLVTLNTEERWTLISDFVYDTTTASSVVYWVAGHRKIEHSPNWHWMTSHEDFTYTAWNTENEQPDLEAEPEACLGVLAKDESDAPGLWWDFDCYTVGEIKYICEAAI